MKPFFGTAQPMRQAYDYWQELPLQETCFFARNLKKASLFCTKNAWKGALPLLWNELQIVASRQPSGGSSRGAL